MTLWQRLKHKWFGTNYVWVQWGHAGEIREITKTPNGLEIVHIYGELVVIGDGVNCGRKIVRLT